MKNMIILILVICIPLASFSQAREWKKAEKLNTIESYQEFLTTFPNSEYINLANLQLEKLYAERDWMKAIETNDINVYEEFLKNHEGSTYAYEAKINIAKLNLPLRAKQRIEAGEVEPPKVSDPGGVLCNCAFSSSVDINKLLRNGLIVWNNPFGGDQIICVNYGDGKKLLNWRKWYCKGENNNCVLSRWENGQPTFEDYKFKGTASYNFGEGIVINLEGVEFAY